MKITDLLSKDAIKLNGIANSKQDAINKLVDLMAKNGNLTDKEKYTQVVLKREEEGSTGIGEGIAIPHGKTDAVSKPGLSAMVINDGVEFDSLDGQPAKLLFLIAAPNTKDNVHLDVLSRLSTLLMDTEFRKSLMEAKTPEEFLRYIDIAENAKLSQTKKNDEYEILAITSCPTGIAHTYMAAEALEKMGEQLGHKVKVETPGSSGVKNKFTKEEREAGPTNFIMGLAFITEGAIPFAASDPLHVLPACIIGSGLAGALSMVFNCTLMAPHGGIFVFPVVGNGLMYFVALVAGTIVSAVLLGALKKKVA